MRAIVESEPLEGFLRRNYPALFEGALAKIKLKNKKRPALLQAFLASRWLPDLGSNQGPND